MSPQRRGGLLVHLAALVADIDGYQSPGKMGLYCCPPIVVGRLFDIVGLDEGTCGRRRLVPGVLRLRVPV